MSDNTFPALDIIRQRILQDRALDLSRVEQSGSDAKSAISYATGEEVVDLLGDDVAYRPAGGGVGYAEGRSVQVAAESVGPGILSRTAAYGAVGAQEATYISGRLSAGADDTEKTFFRDLRETGGEITWNNNVSNPINIDRLTLNVPCMEGVTTRLRVSALMEVHAANGATGIVGSLVVGESVTTGIPSMNNLDTPYGKPWTVGYGDGWDLLPLEHERLILGTSDTANGVAITVRLQRIGGAPGTYTHYYGIAPGATVRVNTSGVNLRSEAGIETTVVNTLNQSASGLVVAGPVWVDGLKWVQVAFNQGIGAGWVAAQYLTEVVETINVPQTNVLRNGWIRCIRIPV